jgi:hypothetical protein
MEFVIRSYGTRLLNIVSLIVQSFRIQWIFFVVPALYLASNWILLSSLETHRSARIIALLVDLLSLALPVGFIVIMLLRFVQYLFIEKPESPVRALGSEITELFIKPARIINALPVFAAMVFFNKAMVEMKPAIPAINPFSWDTTFMQLDRILHFGVDPWVLMQPLLGFDYATFLINIAYDFWFIALFGAWFWFGFRKDANELRTRFFLSYMLIWWVGGGLLAILFSSAGPVYYGAIGLSPDPYTGLFAYLHDVDTRIPLWMLKAQQLLWDGYTGKTAALGISAFPSMHNASAVLFALALMKCSRFLGAFFYAYAGVILIGSVHLGWHYAVDGYGGILIGLLGWWIAGPIAKWFTELPSTRRFNENLASL